ncbi:sulfotransferase [Candidatus Parcubacteria bacterium]|nr:sulfotransferase [Candidatus Parcubacteria bacterium]
MKSAKKTSIIYLRSRLNAIARHIPRPVKKNLFLLRYCWQKITQPKINKQPVFILGNQKSGSTVIATLLALHTGQKASIDLRNEYARPALELFQKKKITFVDFINNNKLDFSKNIIKSPELTFFSNELKKNFNKAKFVLIIRDPRDNIRSILNRLNIPGDQADISAKQFAKLKPNWQKALRVNWLNEKEGNYIENLAVRWNKIANIYNLRKKNFILIHFEDFLKNKKEAIKDLAEKLGLEAKRDIGKLIDKQFQPAGNRRISHLDFFGKNNLKEIENICQNNMKTFGYMLNRD